MVAADSIMDPNDEWATRPSNSRKNRKIQNARNQSITLEIKISNDRTNKNKTKIERTSEKSRTKNDVVPSLGERRWDCYCYESDVVAYFLETP